jgi:hypothetical protein
MLRSLTVYFHNLIFFTSGTIEHVDNHDAIVLVIVIVILVVVVVIDGHHGRRAT